MLLLIVESYTERLDLCAGKCAEKVHKVHPLFAQCVVRREIVSVKPAIFRAENIVFRHCLSI